VLGRDLAKIDGDDLVALRRQLGFIFQLHNLFPALTARQAVQMAADLRDDLPGDSQQRIVALLGELGLGERLDYKPERLSGGQRQRVAVARALVHRPLLLLADEPTAALDADNTHVVLDLFRRLAHEEGSGILMVTQDSRVFESADRLIRLVDGRIESDTRMNDSARD